MDQQGPGEPASLEMGAPASVRDLFRHNGKPYWPVIVLFLAINVLVGINSIWHHPKIGYDVVDNLTYIQVLLHHLPKPTDTGEYFSPPLPFFLPALFDKVCTAHDSGPLQPFDDFHISQPCRTPDGKFAQGINILLSIGTTILLLLIAEAIRPGNRFYKLSVLLVLANLTVYYKTFAQVRGEPYVVFFLVLSVFLIYRLLKSNSKNWNTVLFAGVSIGCLILSRQWGFFIYPAMGVLLILIYARDHQRGRHIARQFILSGAISLLIGGFFYLHLFRDYGSFSAFNIDKPVYPSPQQAYVLLRKTHLGNFELFRDPVRPAFTGAVLPILYSETWGDYWGYFTYIKPNSSYGVNGYSNTDTFVSYLGRVNLVSIPTTFLLLGAVLISLVDIFRLSRSAGLEKEYLLFMCLVVAAMLSGFSWFIYSYVMASTKVLKTAYVLQGLVVLTLPAAELLEMIRTRRKVVYVVIILILAAAFIHDVPAMITRYNVFSFL